jgi:hypothetical protein
MEIVISRAGPLDAAEIGIIGPAAYASAYAGDWDDAAAFMRQLSTFGEASVRTFMARPDGRTWIARQDGAGVGFLTMIAGSLEPLNSRPGGAEIPRIYLLPVARRGHRPQLLDAAAQARAEERVHLLDVMAHAPWSDQLRTRNFTDIGGRVRGGIRPGLNEMRVMVSWRRLAAARHAA